MPADELQVNEQNISTPAPSNDQRVSLRSGMRAVERFVTHLADIAWTIVAVVFVVVVVGSGMGMKLAHHQVSAKEPNSTFTVVDTSHK